MSAARLDAADLLPKGAGETTALSISNLGVEEIQDLHGLAALRKLDVSRNALTTLKASALAQARDITWLQCADNRITGEGLQGVRLLTALVTLNASKNAIRSIPPSAVTGLKQLKALVLSHNELKATDFLAKLRGLTTLVLSHNRLGPALSPRHFGGLRVLQKLSVSHNELEELPDLSACAGTLVELRAAGNRIARVHSSVSRCWQLKIVDLGHNALAAWTSIDPLCSCRRLTHLNLKGNPICDGQGAGDASGDGDTDAAGDDGAATGYAAKVRVLFPKLVVMDGRRVMLKRTFGITTPDDAAKAAADARGQRPAGGRGERGKGPPRDTPREGTERGRGRERRAPRPREPAKAGGGRRGANRGGGAAAGRRAPAIAEDATSKRATKRNDAFFAEEAPPPAAPSVSSTKKGGARKPGAKKGRAEDGGPRPDAGGARKKKKRKKGKGSAGDAAGPQGEAGATAGKKASKRRRADGPASAAGAPAAERTERPAAAAKKAPAETAERAPAEGAAAPRRAGESMAVSAEGTGVVSVQHVDRGPASAGRRFDVDALLKGASTLDTVGGWD